MHGGSIYESETACPCCGSPLPASEFLTLNSAYQIATRRGHSVRLTRTEARVLQILLDSREPMDRWRLIERVYADDPRGGPPGALKTVAALVANLRHKLRPLGVRIARYKFILEHT